MARASFAFPILKAFLFAQALSNISAEEIFFRNFISFAELDIKKSSANNAAPVFQNSVGNFHLIDSVSLFKNIPDVRNLFKIFCENYNMNDRNFFRQLGIGVAVITFGVALSIFIYTASTGALASTQSILLYATSFLLMLRFWWRYTELFVRSLPSQNFWDFLFDFAVSFFGILAVLFIGNMQMWALVGAAAMLAAAIRCKLSFSEAMRAEQEKLKRTFFGAVGMLVIFSAIYFLAPAVNNLALAGGIFAVVLVFVVWAAGAL